MDDNLLLDEHKLEKVVGGISMSSSVPETFVEYRKLFRDLADIYKFDNDYEVFRASTYLLNMADVCRDIIHGYKTVEAGMAEMETYYAYIPKADSCRGAHTAFSTLKNLVLSNGW